MPPVVVTEDWRIEERPATRVRYRVAAPPAGTIPPQRAETLTAPRPPLAEPSALKRIGRGFSWIGVLYAAAKGSVVLASVLAGRLLGAVEYGHVNLVLALSTFVSIALTIGFPLAISKFVAEERDPHRQRQIISTAVVSFFVWATALTALLLLCAPTIAKMLQVSNQLLLWAIAYSLLNSIHSVLSSPLLGRTHFAKRGWVEVGYGLSVPLAVGAAVLWGHAAYSAVIFGFCVAFGVGAILSLWIQRKDLHAGFHPEAFRRIWRYVLFGSLGLLSTALVIAPARLTLYRTFSAQEVGVFSAYFNSTAQISLTLLYMVASVVIPIASQHNGMLKIARIRQLAGPAILALWLAFTAGGALALAAFGRHEYPLRLDWLVLFSASATAILIHGLLASLLSARDFRGLCLAIAGSLATGFLNLSLVTLVVPQGSVSAAAAALLGSYLIGLGFYSLVWPRPIEIDDLVAA